MSIRGEGSRATVFTEKSLKRGDDSRDFVRDEAQAMGYTGGRVRARRPPGRAARGKK
jgi:hypothetical protein